MNYKRSLAGEDDTHGKDTVEFQADRGRADAAADLAGDLSAQFVEGATSGEDVSERAEQDNEAEERNVGFRVETMDAYPVDSLPLDLAANAPDANGAALDAEADRTDSDAITDVIDEKDIISEDVITDAITTVGEVTPETVSAEDRKSEPVPSKPRSRAGRKRARRPRAAH